MLIGYEPRALDASYIVSAAPTSSSTSISGSYSQISSRLDSPSSQWRYVTNRRADSFNSWTSRFGVVENPRVREPKRLSRTVRPQRCRTTPITPITPTLHSPSLPDAPPSISRQTTLYYVPHHRLRRRRHHRRFPTGTIQFIKPHENFSLSHSSTTVEPIRLILSLNTT